MSSSPSPSTAQGAPPVHAGNHVQLAPGVVAKIRNPILVVVFTIITLGIYQVFWWYYANRELADYGRARGTKELGDNPTMSTLALFPGALIVVPAIWTFVTTFKRIQAAQRLNGQTADQRLARPRHRHRDLSRARRLHAERAQLRLEGRSARPDQAGRLRTRGDDRAHQRQAPAEPRRRSTVTQPRRQRSRERSSRLPSSRPSMQSDSGSPFRAFWILLATGTFFWVAHVYADLLAARIKGHHRMRRHDVAHVMHREWPLLQASLAARRAARARRARHPERSRCVGSGAGWSA